MLTLLALLALTAVQAETPREENTTKITSANFDMSINYSKINHVLGLDMAQADAFQSIHRRYVEDMQQAAEAPAEQQQQAVINASHRELSRMRTVLSSKQYKKYNMLLNATLLNRGLIDWV